MRIRLPYEAPVGRTHEIVEICRQVWHRDTVTYQGRYYQIPLPATRGSGLGEPLKIINRPVRDWIPVSIAATGPANVALAAEIAEGWEPIFFLPERAHEVWGEALAVER
jgi:alkanesulfonate monooxygenase SsuD/methylene tetrahydromethanopterin reductase-like flavin-dependent oxidoreductase (luciferase family)